MFVPTHKHIKLFDLPVEVQAAARATAQKNLMAPAFAVQVGTPIRGKSPWNPSLSAIAKVRDVLEVPTVCPCCKGSNIACVTHMQVYGAEHSEWPWLLSCKTCSARVTLHPFTNIPVGTLANADLRLARVRAKRAFEPLYMARHMTRTEAYRQLSIFLGIDMSACHVGWFDESTCERVEEFSAIALADLAGF